MSGSLVRGLALGGLLMLGAAGAFGAAHPASVGVPTSALRAQKKPPLAENPAPIALPSETVVIVARNLADALNLLPDYVIVSREKWAATEAELKRLRAELDRKKPPAPTPTRCVLKGKVEGGLVTLQAQFDFATSAPNTTLSVACGLAHAVGASLDGRTPQLLRGSGATDGLGVVVEKPGEHQLTLDLVLALTPRAGGQALLLDLPRAAGTSLDLELPGGAKDVRVGNKPLAEPFVRLKGNQLSGQLGAIDKLDLSWKSAGGRAGPAAVLTAEGLVQVRVAGAFTTDAQLTLKALGGQASRWRLLVPARAEVKVGPADEPRAKISSENKGSARLVTVVLKEPSEAPLTVYVHLTGPALKPGARVSVGPFAVLEAARQSGTVLLSNAAPDLHLDYRLHGDLTRRALKDEEQRRDPSLVAAFHYGQVAPSGKGTEKKPAGPTWGLGSGPWLDLEAEAVRGQIKARVKHLLALRPGGEGPRGPHWRVTTTLTAAPRWADVGRLLVEMPRGCELVEERLAPLPDGVRQVVYDRMTRVVEVRLRGSSAAKELSLSLEAIYSPPEGAAVSLLRGRAELALPRLRGTVEDGGEVVVRVPRDVELFVPEERGPPAASPLELEKQTIHELVWRAGRRAAERVEVAWRHWRPEMRVAALIDVVLGAAEGRVRRHELRFQFPQPAPTQIALRVPAAVGDSLRVVEGGRLGGELGEAKGGARTRLVHLTALPGPVGAGAAGQGHLLVLEYAFALDKGASIAVPLVVAADGMGPLMQGDTKVRVWAEPGAAPTVAGGPWSREDVEEVSGSDRFPSLVVRSGRPGAPLALRLGETVAVYVVLVERALIRASVGEGGVQAYRARYLLTRLAARHLDVELPAPVSTLELRVRLDGRRVDWETMDEKGRRNDGGRTARLRLAPELVRRRAVLEVSYQLSPGRTAGGPMQTTLQAPVLRDHPDGVPTRWQIDLPSGWVPLGPREGGGGGPGEERAWGWRGWLLAPRLALTRADLERWFAGPGEKLQVEETAEGAGGGDEQVPSLVCWREAAGPLVVTHVPQQAWLLVCSLAVLVLGLGLSWLTWPGEGRRRSAVWLWPLLVLLALGLVVCVLLWPTAMAQVAYGCQPGALVLVLVLAGQWLLHERSRRQVIFLPSFSRSRPGSTMQRQREQEAPLQPGEPSTVDVPRPTGSSAGSRAKAPG